MFFVREGQVGYISCDGILAYCPYNIPFACHFAKIDNIGVSKNGDFQGGYDKAILM